MNNFKLLDDEDETSHIKGKKQKTAKRQTSEDSDDGDHEGKNLSKINEISFDLI